MFERFTDRSRKVMQLANQESQFFRHEYIGTEHILLGLIKEDSGVAANVLKNLDVDQRKIRLEVEKIVQLGPNSDQVVLGKLPHTPRTWKVIEYATEEARKLHHNYVGTEHLLLGLLREEEGVAAQVLMNLGLELSEVREEILNLLGPSISKGNDPEKLSRRLFAGGTGSRSPKSAYTPILDSIGRELTALPSTTKLNKLIGREAELSSVLAVLSCRDRPNALLLGEAGVGKCTIVAGLAKAIEDERVPAWLHEKRIVELYVTRLWGDARDWSIATERTQSVFAEVRRAKDTILFLPDLIECLGASLSGLEARHLYAEIIHTLRESASLCVLAATPDAYERCTKRWGSLDQFVQPVLVRPSTVEESVTVLRGIHERYAAFHHVRIPDEILTLIVSSAERQLRGELPGKAVTLLDRTAAHARISTSGHSLPHEERIRILDAEIESLDEQKEAAIAERDFTRGAALREKSLGLQMEKDLLMQEPSPATESVIDSAMVEAVLRELTNSASTTGVQRA